MTRWLLTCTKTGRFWHYSSLAMCYRGAQLHGLTDYTIERDE